MSLTSALTFAQSSLRSLAGQTGLVSVNIANAGSPDHARRSAVVENGAGGVRMVDIRRATDAALQTANLAANAGAAGGRVLAERIDLLRTEILGVDDSNSLQTHLARLRDSLQTWSSTPADRGLAAVAIANAAELADRVRGVSRTLTDTRGDADRRIADDVAVLNRLLARFGEENAAIVVGTRTGRDISDRKDARDALVKEIAAYVPVNMLRRAGGDVVLTTAAGATLFETTARPVAFQTTADLSSGMVGKAVTIDGIALRDGGRGEPAGSLAALIALRDNVLPAMQAQTDSFAAALVAAFAETDQTGAGLPAAQGLFVAAGNPALPGVGAPVPGLAATVSLNPLFDAIGGDPALLRDGGANGLAYRINPPGRPGYADRLIALVDGLEAPVGLDPAGALGAASLVGHAGAMSGWLEQQRAAAMTSAETKGALANRIGESLSNATGVNIDEEMARLLDLEHNYEASARLLAVVDGMLATLIEMAG